ncbi:GNAT family N-acetyltransferase [Rhodobacter ferrooxidans]|nr:GNAT family N-acetyltransferase [Rhodobacter sp. SW2]
MLIRRLDPKADRSAVETLFAAATDYYLMAEGKPPGPEVTEDFFTACPPGCDPAASHRLGVFDGDMLAGVAELSFGFPAPGDAYLGLMILAPAARGHGFGAALLHHIEALARAAGATHLFLGVLEKNRKGRAFWQRKGFAATGFSRVDDAHGLANVLHRLVKPL